MRKSFSIIILALIMTVGLIGCGKKPNTTKKDNKPQANATSETQKENKQGTDTTAEEEKQYEVETTTTGDISPETDAEITALSDEVEKVLKQYLKLFFTYDAKTYEKSLQGLKPITDEKAYADTKKIMEKYISTEGYSSKYVETTYLDINATIEITLDGVKYNGGKAVYTKSIINVIENGKEKTYEVENNLILKDGNWIVMAHKDPK